MIEGVTREMLDEILKGMSTTDLWPDVAVVFEMNRDHRGNPRLRITGLRGNVSRALARGKEGEK